MAFINVQQEDLPRLPSLNEPEKSRDISMRAVLLCSASRCHGNSFSDSRQKKIKARSGICVSERVGRAVAAVPGLLPYLCGFQNPLTSVVFEVYIPCKAQHNMAISWLLIFPSYADPSTCVILPDVCDSMNLY